MMVDQPENEVPGNSIGEEDAQPQAVHEAKEDDKRLPTLTTERPSPTSHPVVGGATADAAAAGIKSFQPKPAAPSAAPPPSPPAKTPDRAHVTVGGIRRKSSLSSLLAPLHAQERVGSRPFERGTLMGSLMRRGAGEQQNQGLPGRKNTADYVSQWLRSDDDGVSDCRLTVFNRKSIQYDTAAGDHGCAPRRAELGLISLDALTSAIAAKRRSAGVTPTTTDGKTWWPDTPKPSADGESADTTNANTQQDTQPPLLRPPNEGFWEASGDADRNRIPTPTNNYHIDIDDDTSAVKKNQPCKWVTVYGVSNNTLRSLQRTFRFPRSLVDAAMLCGSILQIGWHPPESDAEQCAVVVETQALNIMSNAEKVANGVAVDEDLPSFDADLVTFICLPESNTVISLLFDPSDDSCVKTLEYIHCPYSRLRRGSHWSQILMCQVDAIVDKQLPLLEMYATAIAGLDITMVETSSGPNQGHVDLAIRLKRKVQSIRHHAWQWRDLLMEVKQNQYGLLPVAIAGWEDAATHVVDLIDSTIINCAEQSEMASGWISRCAEMDVYFERFLDNRMGDMLYVLTLASVLLMPIQTMSGIFGMNFVDAEGETNIPVLKWKWGYVYFWMCGLLLSCLVLLALGYAGMLRATKTSNKKSHEISEMFGQGPKSIAAEAMSKVDELQHRESSRAQKQPNGHGLHLGDGTTNASGGRRGRASSLTFRGSAKTHPATVVEETEA